MRGGKLIYSRGCGWADRDEKSPVEPHSLFRIASVSKPITAVAILRLVQQQKLKLSDKLDDILKIEPHLEKDAKLDDRWREITIEHCLTHAGGWDREASYDPMFAYSRVAKSLEVKLPVGTPEIIRYMRGQPLDFSPGEKYAYSNVGPTIAAAMVEAKTGATWEDLVQREVFEPLGLTSAGFGPPPSPDNKLPQPRGHRPYLGAKIPVSDTMDNTYVMGPAGSVHMTLDDLTAYANEHLRGQLGKGKLLSAESYQRLHTPRLNRFAYGWLQKELGANTPYTVYWHNGSNTLWYALVVFIPEKNMVVAVAANDGDFTTAEDAAWEIVDFAANDFKPPPGRSEE
jgi:CubicO group peptidase (beta-lactamase class C family)